MASKGGFSQRLAGRIRRDNSSRTSTQGLYGFPERGFLFFWFFFLKKEGWDAVLCSMFNIAFLNSKLSGTLRNAIISVILEPGIEKLQQLQPHLID